MYKTISFILVIVMVITFVPLINVDASESSNIYGAYESFDELYQAYLKAVEEQDVEEQEHLIEIGRTSLLAEIEIAEGNTPAFAADAMEIYQREVVLPQYFSCSYFETRSNGVTLSLGNKLSYWSANDKSIGWNAVRISYQNNSKWDNTEIMQEQFYCHARLGYSAIESEWNLEPWRTSMNPFTCN